jgi:hypothetical protein
LEKQKGKAELTLPFRLNFSVSISAKVPTYLEQGWNAPGTTGLPAAPVLPFAAPFDSLPFSCA